MIKILILILAFNALFTPILAQGACISMPMESVLHQELMDMDSEEHHTSEESDHCQMMEQMDDDMSCCSSKCGSDCASQFSSYTLVPYEAIALFLSVNNRPQIALPYFYHIILPIKTPPPLV